MNTDLLQSPDLTLSGDSTTTLNYRLDAGNYITQLFGAQLPAIDTGFFNVHMTRDIVVQPHWHTNASEMVFVISGEAATTVFNPFTRKSMSYRLTAGQVSILPKGWFHWIIALSDHVHLLTIFDKPTPDIVTGADFLTALPDIVHRAFCMDRELYAQAVAPAADAAILGPAPACGIAPSQVDGAPGGAGLLSMPPAAHQGGYLQSASVVPPYPYRGYGLALAPQAPAAAVRGGEYPALRPVEGLFSQTGHF